jgi:putative membrane protein
LWIALAGGTLALGGVAYAQRAPDMPATGTSDADRASEDARVVAKLHHINQMEIDAGKLAQDKGQSKKVRDFGGRLVRDHQAADKKVMSYADKKGIDANAMPPAGTDQEAKDQEKMDRLRNLSGAQFDREFATMMAEGHQKAIEMVQAAQGRVNDPALRTMLTQLLPTLQKHHDIAESLAGSLRNVSSDTNMPETGARPSSTQQRPSENQ